MMLHLLMLGFFIVWGVNIANSWGAPKLAPLKSREDLAREARKRADNAAWAKTYAVILGLPCAIWLLVTLFGH